jgi:hypothetical protein
MLGVASAPDRISEWAEVRYQKNIKKNSFIIT